MWHSRFTFNQRLRTWYQEWSSQYQIAEPNQRKSSSWLNALQFGQFKVKINSFLVSAWQDDSLAEIFEGKCLYVINGGIFYCFREENGKVTRTLIPKLTSSQDEADSKMIHHFTILKEDSEVIIYTSDTDVLLIALGWLDHIRESINVWVEVGLYAKNSLKYIDVRTFFNKLGKMYVEPYHHSMFSLFLKRYQPKKKKKVVISCVKKLKDSFLPPCASVLQQMTNWEIHIAGKFVSFWTSHPPMSNPSNCEWELSNEDWKVKWFDGDIA